MLLSLLFFLSFLSPFHLSLSLTQDGIFLLQAKLHLSDPSNSLSSWNSSDPTPCNWYGITCRNTTVTAVNLTSLSLSGPFPISLCHIPSLTSLSLSNNFINSSLPSLTLPNCRHLRHLNLSQNTLVGPIPHTLSQISSLRHLDLSSNNLSGPIPSSLATLSKLKSLILVYNFLTGPVPDFLGNISSLKLLHLAYNPFTPSHLPSQLANLTNLESLWCTSCNLVGSIPHSLGALVNLKSLDLAENNLTGTIPESFSGLKSVTQIELYSNSLSGELPLGLSNLTQLESFDASMNELTGTIPEGLCGLKLASLNLYSNKLEGSLPEVIANSPKLSQLKLFNNSLVGELPKYLGRNSPLNQIDVSYNNFSGEFPASLCNGGQLEQLILMYNSFSGKIPESLGNCKSLRRVRLRNNKLSGIVPDGFWGLPQIFLLEVIENSLSGRVSNSISGAKNLSSLLISKNQFNGSIPDEIGYLGKLLEFDGSYNKFSGQLPKSMARLSQLNNLHLSHNEFSGEIPGGIVRDWTQLNHLNLASNRFNGKIPIELGSLPVLNYLDLSSNYFSGEIPKQLQNLKLNVLNLSNNQLSGDIPPLFANENYRMSFEGNPGLCGDLPGLCPSSGESKKRKHAWIFSSIFVLAGVLFVVGVGWFYLKYRNMKKLKKASNISKWRLFHKLGFSEFEIVELMSEDNVIGSGASGKVYKVVLSNGEMVAVKKLWGTNKNLNGVVTSGKDDFEAEIETVGKIRHKNILRLWCCCNSGDSKLLVYEYMAYGSLGDMLKGSKKSLLDWPIRYKIAIDAAEGLAYLHHDCAPPIVHRDVKSNNILLDREFCAKVADFGVAKVVGGVGPGAESMSVVAGSYGYFAPEYAYTLRVNEKSDIYSFGVVILELVTGKPPIDPEYGESDLVKWVSSTLEQKGPSYVIDPSLDSKYTEVISKVLSVGLICTSSLPITRPPMRRVVKMLQEATTVPNSTTVKDVILSPQYYEEAYVHQGSVA